MFGLKSKILGIVGIATALVIAGLLGWGMRVDHLRARWKTKYEITMQHAGRVVFALSQASDNPDVTWEVAPGQITALGESNRALKAQLASQNLAIDLQAAEAVRLRAQAAELKVIADKARAQRASALARLSDMAASPGTRSDCMTLLREAEAALDIVYEKGA